ncbi:MAG: rubredoxin [Epulopiscium sp.]|nr:rubredoxin [Candidatus Epulonipiscium sp.]
MSKYICSICNYIYEGNGEVPDDFICPICGAGKEEFYQQDLDDTKEMPITKIELPEDIKEMSPMEISALFSNLARGAEMQYKDEEAELFASLAKYYSDRAVAIDGDFAKLIEFVKEDLENNLPYANARAEEDGDRGALRALVWSGKVTRILNSILARYEEEGDAMLEGAGIHVCTICGFIYIGDSLPEVCPVCKVPNWKFAEIEGGN